MASRAYLDEHGRPQQPDDLLAHRTIRMSNVVGSETLVLYATEGRSCSIPFDGLLGLAAREALIQGCGIAPAHIWLVDDLLQVGSMEQVLPDYTLESVPLSILIVPGRARIKRIRSLIDTLSDTLKALPGIG